MTLSPTLLLINADPSQPIAWHAYRYAKAYLNTAISVDMTDEFQSSLRIFFYGEAAHTGNVLRWQTADRESLTQLWSELSQRYGLKLPICVSTALHRGVTDADNAKRHKLSAQNLAKGFELVGLGELAEQLTLAKKVISF